MILCLDLRSRVIRQESKPADESKGVEEGEVIEDDSGVILVDENNGAPVKMPKRKLKEEAMEISFDMS